MTGAGNLFEAPGSNDRERFDALMRAEGSKIYSLAVRLTGNPADGQDLAAETFVRAFHSFSSFRGEAAFGTWVHRICLNLWKNRLRAQKRRHFWSHFSLGNGDDEGVPLDPPSREPSPDAPLMDGERREAVAAALDRLSPEEKAIVVMRDLDDASYDEISRALDVPLGTVKSRLARARGRLQELLKDCL